MTQQENLCAVNNSNGAEYSGWWFACFPISFIRENDPLPFFLHCDDVEYGLRQGKEPIILNGIQVWHETYEYRQTPMIAYFDTRNPLIVNQRYGLGQEKEAILEEWKRRISAYHVRQEYLMERMIILGMWDYLKGEKWFFRRKLEKEYKRLTRKRYLLRYGNAVLWRVAEWRYNKKINDYQMQ